MSTTILTNEQIDETIESIGPDWWDVPPGADLLFARAIEQAVLQSPEIQALRRRVEDLEKIVAECRDAMPIPNVGSKAEECWPEAMSDAGGVPDFIKASVEALRKDAERLEWMLSKVLITKYGIAQPLGHTKAGATRDQLDAAMEKQT